ncbi:alpha-1,6-mannosyl-glycoprotein 2-beta-N-acetylglucosaminyltransferase [Helicoverpa armigera]|uniref:alpha-1,6-mannosyl-glycoprotein 2-beta-N-acetylglucosaminyltransferase n=1 Tax=Helicoverpa armigera TaxID=29058 RepID=UPI0021136734|nr:alpha-1,6-mannosyl-glycoprotein 2-beta-N-acetylglucosaminyltransferase [Helicoverpa armigera]
MNLKLLIFRARSRGVPVYCCLLLCVYLVLKYFYWRPLETESVPKHLRGYLKFAENFKFPRHKLRAAEIKRLSSLVELLNNEREVFQTRRYGAVRGDTTTLVVQVHRDAERLQTLIVSLAQVRYIHTVLVVFSHSYYDNRINKLVASITFCRYMQIFYPYSLQLYPNKFPGIDPEDCLSVQGKRDKYCSNRDGRLTEHKHHWWWKACFIFNNLDWSDNFKGTVIFLEEDNYVLPDLLYMLRYTTRTLSYLQGIHVMSFGRPYAKYLDYDLLSVLAWRPPFDNGLAFNKTIWQKIMSVSSYFCMYDDVSWSYSLLNAFGKLRAGRADVVATAAPRVLSTSMFPSGRAAVRQISAWLADAKLFPVNVKAVMLYGSSGRIDSGSKPPPWGNGGWSDMRDHLLCLDPLMSTTTANFNDLTATSDPLTSSTTADYLTIAHHRVNMSDAEIRHLL